MLPDDALTRTRLTSTAALLRCAALAAFIVLAPSAAAEATLSDPVGLHQESAAVLDAIDWNEAEFIDVTLEDHGYRPTEILLERNRPYVLRLRNIGHVPHDMAGGSFFSGIAVKMVQAEGGRLITPVLRSLYLKHAHQMEVWFVPLRAGHYTFFCSISGHRERGMEGHITVR